MANDRVSQLPVEGVTLPTSGKARPSQLPVEGVTLPTSGKARPSQLPVEVVLLVLPDPFVPQIIRYRN